MDALVNRADELHQALIDFVLDAEGDLAVALETYSADMLRHFAKAPLINSQQQQWAIALFSTEGQTDSGTPLERFIAEFDGSESDREMLRRWHSPVIGVFAVQSLSADQMIVINWLTAKQYTIALKTGSEQAQLARLKPDDIVVTSIASIADDRWILSAPFMLLGKLGKPKLAVVIGNFRQTFKPYLYSDAPELLVEAWASVDQYHQSFLKFFGADEVTLPGTALSQKLAEFQQQLTQDQFRKAGLDPSKSLQDLADDAGITADEITDEIAAISGVDAKAMLNQPVPQMSLSKIELPTALRHAEAVTVLTHPRWGQHFLADYVQFKHCLESDAGLSQPEVSQLLRRYIEQSEVSPLALYRLADTYPAALAAMLQAYLGQPDSDLMVGVQTALQQADKPIEPELPDTASVPLHLHQLFQEAIAEVKPEKSKPKSGRKAASGFKR